jgi:MarR family transcriptional regulator, organic hydroperoxide resistance regulator
MSPHKKLNELVSTVHKLNRTLSDIFKYQMAKEGIRDFNPTAGVILLPLLENEGLTLSELAKSFHMKAPTITVLANRLEVKGLIRRERGKNDRRQVRIYLTTKGREKASVLFDVRNRAIERMAPGLNIESISLANETLEKIISNVLSQVE